MVQREVGAAGSGARAQHALEINGTQKTGNHAAGRGAVSPGARASDGQALAALGAAGVDHGTAATGLHADQEPMGAGAANFGGLVSAFHDLSVQLIVFPEEPGSTRRAASKFGEVLL